MKIQLLLTGNELMSGHVVDSNSAMIAELLAESGYKVHRKVTINDDLSEIVDEINNLTLTSDVLLINGGLGPTVDDLTAEALSLATSRPLEKNQIAVDHLEKWCKPRKTELNEANLKQAILPKGVTILPNPVGSAVGFSIEHEQCLVLCTPGVPSELRKMMRQTIVKQLCQRFPVNGQTDIVRYQTFGLGESTLQQLVNDHLTDWPQEVDLGFRAGLPLLEVKLTVQQDKYRNLLQKCQQHLISLIGDYIIGPDNTTLAEAVNQLLTDKKQSVTTAESCTGGLIASSITAVAGASAVFEAGFITYSNAMKVDLVGVDKQLLNEHGAVSEQVVMAMARGAINRSRADYGIAVSGIAGPDGGSEDKPVGTVWIAWGQRDTLKTTCMVINRPRKWFQQMVTAICLDLIRRELLGITKPPRYIGKTY